MRPFWFTGDRPTDRHARRRCCGVGRRVAPPGGSRKGRQRGAVRTPPRSAARTAHVRVRRRSRPHTHAHAHREDKGKSNGGHAKTNGGDRVAGLAGENDVPRGHVWAG